MAERAVALLDRLGASPQARAEAYQLRGLYSRKAKRRTEAMADMERALDLIELARTQASGTGVEKAAFFGAFDSMYENMVVMQCEADDPSAVLRAIERSHARSLLEEFSIAGTDLDLGRPAEERDRLRARERELSAAISGLKKRSADGDKDPGLAVELAATRDRFYDHHREARASSPVYQGLITSSGGPVRLSTIQRKLLQNFGALVVYYIGPQYSCVVVAGTEVNFVVKLELDEMTARTLGVQSGVLSAKKLHDALINAQGTGVVQMLADRVKSKEATPKLAALWKLLIPDALKKSLVTRETKKLIIIPDGPLAILPFEALVVEPGEDPKYLLDFCPPITYCPSASVLSNLVDRPSRRAANEVLLTVGDPSYPGDQPALAVAANDSTTRFGAGGGRLPRLPFTAREVEWVVKGTEENKLKAVSLLGANATEAAVRATVAGRKFVHLACHGLTDADHGNFFGALALTPGPKAANDPENDGFLTLTEIYRLNLGACEVGILSACNTNFGPEQKGEGTWAVSRGFLVAGARRVVASNWLVRRRGGGEPHQPVLDRNDEDQDCPAPGRRPQGDAPKGLVLQSVGLPPQGQAVGQ
jgi:CHAT domain